MLIVQIGCVLMILISFTIFFTPKNLVNAYLASVIYCAIWYCISIAILCSAAIGQTDIIWCVLFIFNTIVMRINVDIISGKLDESGENSLDKDSKYLDSFYTKRNEGIK